MNFLGRVNIFHGRVQNGRALLGPIALDYPDHPDPAPRPAAGYVRPHDLLVSRTPDDGAGTWARVTTVHAAGGVVKLELADDDGRPIQVELGREPFEGLGPAVGERLYVRPRALRVFVAPESP
jgi:sulfate transport system ATP-binding protein